MMLLLSAISLAVGAAITFAFFGLLIASFASKMSSFDKNDKNNRYVTEKNDYGAAIKWQTNKEVADRNKSV